LRESVFHQLQISLLSQLEISIPHYYQQWLKEQGIGGLSIYESDQTIKSHGR